MIYTLDRPQLRRLLEDGVCGGPENMLQLLNALDLAEKALKEIEQLASDVGICGARVQTLHLAREALAKIRVPDAEESAKKRFERVDVDSLSSEIPEEFQKIFAENWKDILA